MHISVVKSLLFVNWYRASLYFEARGYQQTESALRGFQFFVGFEKGSIQNIVKTFFDRTHHCKVFERAKNEDILNCEASCLPKRNGLASFNIGLHFDMKELF